MQLLQLMPWTGWTDSGEKGRWIIMWFSCFSSCSVACTAMHAVLASSSAYPALAIDKAGKP